ncbi:uncharacterized protein EDB91DRAFT_1249370 [Suillus paluster]|uniref:uncharacterized protein n=1 Tax=Suillus paluster TaxID=48578 RepID=UPI001B85DC6C|nr:uncharacterized protein EDB91DRAFT_1249370 [Suillus paluster]KAG1738073.1 hypothetical protein EDB91DRAFT_1249370 [Suillus paluster]
MTSSSTDNTVPAASIGGLQVQALLNVSGTSTVTLTSALYEVVQNAVITALQEVATASTGAPALAGPSAPAIPATLTNTVPTATAFQTTNMVTTPANTAALPVRTHCGVTYHVPRPDASSPFYWVNCGCHIGIFATWQGASTHVTGVSRSSFSRVHSVAEGIRLITEAIDCRETEIIP